MATPVPTDHDRLLEHRQGFPALAQHHYFNYGGQGPMATATLESMAAAHRHLQSLGPFSTAANRWIGAQAAAIRQVLAAELGVGVDSLSLTEDVTVGCNIALWGLPWQAGDHILLSDSEHPGVVAAVQELCRRYQLNYTICPLQGEDGLAAITAHLQPRTRLLVISHVLWNTGQVLPLAAIADLCHQHRPQPVWVLVDGAQAVGMLPFNLQQLGVDFYAFTGHKWWCGPPGLGGLYVNPAVLADLRPTFIGWRGIATDGAANPIGWQPNGQRFEVATSDYSLYAGLATAIATQHQWGTPEQRYQRICQLSQQLWTALHQIPQVHCLSPTPPASGLVSFQLGHRGESNPAWHRQLVEQLEDRGLLLRILLSPHCLRACTHYLTLESEIAYLVECIQAIAIKQFVTKRTY